MTEIAGSTGYIPFDSFTVGQVQDFGAYEVTETEIIEFAQKYDPQYFHLDADAAKESLFGGLCASGWHTCAMTMAMLVENMDKTGRSLGSPGLDSLKWRHPVYPGDVLSVHTEILETKPSESRPEIGFIISKVTVRNQRNRDVMEFVSKGIFPRA
ncbi:MAG: MaoC family dehydratase [Sulfitobacter sp.]|jgi:acyl dehydratase